MAVINGFLAGQTISGYDRLYITADLDDYGPGWIDDIVYWAAIPSPGATTLATHWPVSAAPDTRTGWIARSYADDFYHRIHIVPAVLDIGNLLSVQTRQAAVWNAHLVPQALASIAESGTTGLTESGIVAPTTFAPLEERTYSITVDTDGPATIDALYTFAFTSESPTLSVTGRRVVVFSHAPDWTSGLTEVREWMTDVIESYGGFEQRSGLRGVPRVSLEYSTNTITQDELNRLDTLIMGWQTRLFALPVWTDVQYLSATLPAGSPSVSCATSGYEFADGALAVIMTGYEQYEAIEISTVGAGVIVFAEPTQNAWPAGAMIMPVRLCRIPSIQAARRDVGIHFSYRMKFVSYDAALITPEEIGDQYLGHYVYPNSPSLLGDIDLSINRSTSEIDYRTNAPSVIDRSGLASVVRRYYWLHRTRSEIVAFRAWMSARKGRLVPFWLETQGMNLSLAATIGSSDTSIKIKNIGYQRYLDGRADRKHIAIRTKSGSAYYRTINGSAEDSDAIETLLIDAALGATVGPADVASIHFLHLTRLESDSVSIDWQTLGVAETTTALRSLPG